MTVSIWNRAPSAKDTRFEEATRKNNSVFKTHCDPLFINFNGVLLATPYHPTQLGAGSRHCTSLIIFLVMGIETDDVMSHSPYYRTDLAVDVIAGLDIVKGTTLRPSESVEILLLG